MPVQERGLEHGQGAGVAARLGYCLGLLLVVLLVVAGQGRVHAQEAASTPPELPEIATLEARIQALEPQEGAPPDGATERDLEALKATRQMLEALADLKDQMATLEQRIASAPAEIEDLQQALSQEASAATDLTFEALDGLSTSELDARLQAALNSLQELQDRLSGVNTRLIDTQTLPERAQQAIAEAMQTLEQDQGPEGGGEGVADSPQRLERLAEMRLADLTVGYHQRALHANSQLRELAQLRQEQLNRQIARLETRLAMLQAVLDRKRRAESEQAIQAASAGGPLVESEHPAVQQARQVNRELSLELLKATERANSMAREGLQVHRQLDRVRQLQRTLNVQIDAIRGSLLLSRILREQRHLLPQVEQRRNLKDDIADLRLKQFELGRQREALRDSTALAQQRLEEEKVEPTPELMAALERLLASRLELVDQLELAYGEQLSAAIDLQLNQQQLLSLSRQLSTTIDEQLFWVANSRHLDLAWLRQVPTRMIETWRDGEWRALLPLQWPGPGALVGLLPMLVAVGLFLLRPPIKRHLVLLNDQIGHLKHDTQALTPLSIALNALLAAPGPLLMASLGLALVAGAEGVMTGLGMALLQLALAWGSIAWARRLLVRDGVAMRHFLWPPAYAARLSWLLLWLGVSLVPVLMITSLARGGGITLADHPLVLLMMLMGLGGMAMVQSKLIAAHAPFFGILLLRLLIGLALAAVPLLLIGLIVLGFEYTALRLVSRYVITLYLLGTWIVVEASVVRGLAVAARRLAYRRALARRRAQKRDEPESGMEVVEEPPLDMNQVNQQSLRLSKLILMLGLVVLLYLVWADLLSVLGYLDQVAVWGGDAAEGTLGVSVADVLIALATVALTTMLARNLPGLLEVMVLSRLALKQGSAYAISSLLSYAIGGGGLILAFGTLGVTWDKLQWLVAALGVGLGFGLQEIFANFISGLIILFERPVRIGDTITLGNLHGTVSRIRIRATTVTDFDRKEIIIPNKTFVTDQLINWSLSDNITRVVLTYGVAYGSDLALVHRLLHEAATANERVLKDPEPQVFFLQYGASSLEFELRIFVNSLLDRLHAADEINVDIAARFKAHGVEIAFDQLDVRLHDAAGGPIGWGPPGRSGGAEGKGSGAARGDAKVDGEPGEND